jgi:hypothetical protein
MLKIVAFLLSVLVGVSPVATPEAVTVQETMPRVVVDELEDNDMAVLEVSWRDGDIHRIVDVSWHEFNHEVKEEMELEVYSVPVVVDEYGPLWPGADDCGWHVTDTEGNPRAAIKDVWFEDYEVAPRCGDVYMMYFYDNQTEAEQEDDILLMVRPVWQW